MTVGEFYPFDYPDEWDYVTIAGVPTPGVAKVTGWSRDLNYDVKVGRGTAGATITLAGKPPAKGSIEFQVWGSEQMAIWNDQILPLLKFVSHPSGTAAPTGTGTSGADFSGAASSASTGTTATATSTGGLINLPGNSATPAKGDTSGAYASPQTPKALTKADAIDIFHPALADIEVTSVLPPEKLGQWEHQGGMLYTRKIDFIEFTQMGGNIVATPNGSTDNPGANFSQAGGGGAGTPPTPNSASNASGSASDARAATVPAGFGGGKKG